MRILLVEDDQPTRTAVAEILHTQDYEVDYAIDGEAAMCLTQATNYDLVILDIGLPKLNGIQVCQHLRSTRYSNPILLLTAQGSTRDRVIGLNAGADDYLSKPFDTEELLARIRVLLRRRTVNPVLVWQNIRVDSISGKVTCHDREIHLTPKELRVLELFLVNPNRIFSRSAILDRVWDTAESPGEETISTHIKCIRQKLKVAGSEDPLETVHGLGYRLRNQKAPASDKIQTKTTELWHKFEKSFLEQISTLETLLESPSAHTREPAKNIAHKLAGSLGIFGFIESSRIAKELEVRLQSEQEPIPSDLVHTLRRSLQTSPGPNAQTVLIIDDDRAVLERLSTLLQPLEVAVITLEQPDQFWHVLETAQPSLLLLDLEMPQVDGLELCQSVRNHPNWRDLAIVILSSAGETEIRETVLTAGANDYCNKSAPATELLSRILRQLDVKNSERF